MSFKMASRIFEYLSRPRQRGGGEGAGKREKRKGGKEEESRPSRLRLSGSKKTNKKKGGKKAESFSYTYAIPSPRTQGGRRREKGKTKRSRYCV